MLQLFMVDDIIIREFYDFFTCTLKLFSRSKILSRHVRIPRLFKLLRLYREKAMYVRVRVGLRPCMSERYKNFNSMGKFLKKILFLNKCESFTALTLRLSKVYHCKKKFKNG